MNIEFIGAARQVTGSAYLIRIGQYKVLLDCGQFQGGREERERNQEPLPVRPQDIDAVVLSHAHIDHSGRLPLLSKEGYTGSIYTHHATRALCEIMLRDSAYLHEKDAEWENRKRRRKGMPLVAPLYTQEDAAAVTEQFKGVDYGHAFDVVPGMTVRLRDAGHILGAAIVEIWLRADGAERKLVFSGDLGYRDAPIMDDPELIDSADLVLLESTYGDRLHRSFDATLDELASVFAEAEKGNGNIIIPAFAVGRTQDLIYLMAEHFAKWDLGRWQVFLDSPMAIEATEVYSRYRYLYGAQLFRKGRDQPVLKNLLATKTSEQSMALNKIESGAIIIAGSGMCTGGRVLHHLKHNLWRRECHVVIVGFQAYGTLGRRLVDGANHVRLWHENIKVAAQIHTVGGLSAHADQAGLLHWYGSFKNRPAVCLVHGELRAQKVLAGRLKAEFGVVPRIPERGDRFDLLEDLETS